MDERIWHKAYMPGISANYSFKELTMPEFLTQSAGRFPDHTALVFNGRKISFTGLEILVNRFADGLKRIGVSRGDRIALLMPNIPQMVISFYAAWRIGAIPVPNNPLYTDKELEYQLNNCGATHLISLDLLTPRMLALRSATAIRTIITAHINDYLPFPVRQLFPFLKRDMYCRYKSEESYYQLLDIVEMGSADFVPYQNDLADTAIIPYTGGTTGVSKGTVLTHANISYITQIISDWLIGTEDGKESELAIFPFFHMAGFTAVMNVCIYKGWTDILIPRPEPKTVVDLTLKHKPTIFLAVPTIYTGILADSRFTNADLSHIKVFFSGAAPLALDTIKALEKAANVPIVEGYGMTESTTIVTLTPCGGKLKPGSVGVPVPETDLRIVDLETGEQDLPIGEAGEIIVKGPQILSEYFNMPQETQDSIRNGWFYTGDIGKMDKEGFLYIVDRKKDMIIAGGYNIYPRDIEEVLMEHPKIREVAAVGLPHEYRGETVKAYVVPVSGEQLSEAELDAFCRERLAAYKVPRIYEFMDELPKSNIGKILKRELKAKAAQTVA